MSKIHVPDMLLEQLVCITCKCYLSVFPIHVSIKGLGALCGRCPVPEDFIQDQAYENLVEFLLFPCANKKNGCPEIQTPTSLEQHERECEYVKFPCISKKNCEWKGAQTGLLKHFEEEHGDMILKEPSFKFNFKEAVNDMYLLKHESEFFLVYVDIDLKLEKVQCSVKHLKFGDSSVCYSYDLQFISGQLNHNSLENGTATEDKPVEMKASFLNDCLSNPAEITVQIKFKEPFKNREALDKSVEIKCNPNIDWKLLSELECPVCYDYMLPPVYQCLVGHSICEWCKPKLKECPTCKSKLQDTRNFILEKMTQKMNYPCKYYKQGCAYYTLSGEVKKHENGCEYGPLLCPMSKTGCKWNGNICDVVAHTDNNHNENILKTDKVELPFKLTTNSEHVYLIKFSKKIFKLTYKYANRMFYWSVQLAGMKNDCQAFRYEVKIIDLSGSRREYCIVNLVDPQTGNEPFGDTSHYISQDYEQIKALVKDKIAFKLRVLKD